MIRELAYLIVASYAFLALLLFLAIVLMWRVLVKLRDLNQTEDARWASLINAERRILDRLDSLERRRRGGRPTKEKVVEIR